jgi:hypothetical protein
MARGSKGRRAGAAGSTAAPPSKVKERGGRKGKRRQVGPRRQWLKEKEKGVGRGGPARETGWAAWAEREPVLFSFFSSFLFQTSFSNHFSSQIQFKLFQTFLKNFINLFLETTQATKNHASQLMMHIHLLSLSLLNYI